MAAEVITLRVRGENGVEFDFDLPPLGTPHREVFEYQVGAGLLVVLDGDWPPGATDEAEPTDEPKRRKTRTKADEPDEETA